MAKFNRKRILLIIAVAGLLIFLHFIKILAPVETVLARALNPIFSGFYSLGVYTRTIYRNQANQENFAEQIAVLTARVDQLTEENIGLKLGAEENKTLREHLNFLTSGRYNYVISNVISRGDPAELSGITESIIIDKGARDGLYAGLAVVSSEGIIVGKIEEVKEAIAKVYLTNSDKCKIAATILNGNKTAGITEGDLGLTIIMNFIPQDIEIKIGDIVVTSGLEQTIPRGLAVGSVISVNKENNDLWQTATLEPLADPDALTIVSVILP